MGAWDVGNFDNDTACDWTYELENCTDLSVIKKALDAVFEDEYIDADVASEALAAIDTIARLKGSYGVQNAYTETVDEWVKKNQLDVPGDMLSQSLKALEAITSEVSELYELWDESGSMAAWEQEVSDLKSRLKP